jgi:hypothetical protein
MKNIPINLSGHVAKIVEEPTIKMRETDGGVMEPVTGFDGTTQFVVSVFLKPLPREEGRPAGKGEEIKFTLTADPGDGFTEDTRVEFIDPTVSAFSFKAPDGREVSGISFKAVGLKPAGGSSFLTAA